MASIRIMAFYDRAEGGTLTDIPKADMIGDARVLVNSEASGTDYASKAAGGAILDANIKSVIAQDPPVTITQITSAIAELANTRAKITT